MTRDALGAINSTDWLYLDKNGVEGIQVNPNVVQAELLPAQAVDGTEEFKVTESGSGFRRCRR